MMTLIMVWFCCCDLWKIEVSDGMGVWEIIVQHVG